MLSQAIWALFWSILIQNGCKKTVNQNFWCTRLLGHYVVDYINVLFTENCIHMYQTNTNIYIQLTLNIPISYSHDLKTNICDEWVCSAETSHTTLIAIPCFPECGRAGSISKCTIWNFELLPWTPSLVHVPTEPTPLAYGITVHGGGGGASSVLLLVSCHIPVNH